jgi:hypothetical protein
MNRCCAAANAICANNAMCCSGQCTNNRCVGN